MRNRYFIWKRHTPRQKPRHTASFWADTLLLIAMGVAWFFVRPWKAQPLGHATGTVRKLCRCLRRAPQFKEPPARRKYILAGGPEPQLTTGWTA